MRYQTALHPDEDRDHSKFSDLGTQLGAARQIRAASGAGDRRSPGGEIRRNDLLFWPGHVAIALDAERMIHATGFAMAVIIEPMMPAIARIEAAGQGPFLGSHRPLLAATGTFP